MTYSILFVGYGGSDPHLEELRYFFQWSKSPLLPKYFLFIQKAKAGKLLVTYKEKLSTQIIEVPDYSYTTQFLQEIEKDSAANSIVINSLSFMALRPQLSTRRDVRQKQAAKPIKRDHTLYDSGRSL
jgi:hypothetical protein